MGEHRQEFVLAAVGLAQRRFRTLAAGDLPLGRVVQPGVVDPCGGLGRNGDDELLGALCEHAGVRMTEEQAADHLPGAGHDRHGQIAAHLQMSFGHPVVRCHQAITRVFGDIGGAHYAFAAECRVEHGSVAWDAELLERFARRSGEGIQEERFALAVDDVVEERTEARAADLCAGIGYRLHQGL